MAQDDLPADFSGDSGVLTALPLSCLAPVCPCRSELLHLRQQVGYWQAMHKNAVARCNDAQQEIEQLWAQLRLRERQLFERKSERNGTQPAAAQGTTLTTPPKRARGQQRGRPSPPR